MRWITFEKKIQDIYALTLIICKPALHFLSFTDIHAEVLGVGFNKIYTQISVYKSSPTINNPKHYT